MQVTSGSLIGAFGPKVQKCAESFVQQGLIHFISTDAHGPKSRRPLMRQAFDRCVQLAGDAAATLMFCTNPTAVFEGRDLVAGRLAEFGRAKNSSSFGGWFGRRNAG